MPRKTDQLDEYRRKRDFEKTAEPAGKPRPPSPGRPKRVERLRFVVQKHAASHLHYDLRLELDGVMKSWAVPKGPSFNTSIKRLAMQVEDHPVEYNSFEGTIPRHEYGGGTVMLWDRGTYEPDEPEPGESDADAVRRGLRQGKLSFTFRGQRLRGSFALVRTDGGPKPKWLLLKHRDAHASAGREITDEVVTSVHTGRTMEEIAMERDRVWHSNRHGGPGGEQPSDGATAPAGVIAPMLPIPVNIVPDEAGWTFEPWHAGQQVLAYVTADSAHLIDVAGDDVTARHRHVADELVVLCGRARRPFVLDGELAPGQDGDRTAFHVADMLLDGTDVLAPEPWATRRAALDTLLRRRRLSHIARKENSDDGERLLRRVARHNLPGVLGRRLDAPYEPGLRSDALIRVTSR